MASSDSPKIYAGMLKKELLEVADRLGLRGVSKLRKAELVDQIQAALRRSKRKKGGAARRAKAATSRGRGAAKAATERSGSRPTTTATAAATKPEAKAKKAAASKMAAKPAKSSKGVKSTKTTKKAKVATDSPRPEMAESLSDRSKIAASKYGSNLPYAEEDLRQVDAHLPGLPDGYGDDRIVLLPRDPEWLYAYWDVRGETREEARRRGGANLALRLYEHRGDELEPMAEHWINELARSWYLQVPAPGQSYVVEIGYRDGDGGWLEMLRSNTVTSPPSGPSTVVADEFVTIHLGGPLIGQDDGGGRPVPKPAAATVAGRGNDDKDGGGGETHEVAYQAGLQGGLSVAGSAPDVGPGAPGGAPWSAQPGSPWGGSAALANPGGGGETGGERDFWLVAEAELIVFGATEPTASVTIGGKPIRLRPAGTFSVRMAFPDGKIETPIVAVAENGEQRRGHTMRFDRTTTPGVTEGD